MDIKSPLQVLMATIDAILRRGGTDPATYTTDDKLLLAVQYVEVASVLGVTGASILREARPL